MNGINEQLRDQLVADGFRLVRGSENLYEKGDTVAMVSCESIDFAERNEQYMPQRTQQTHEEDDNTIKAGACQQVRALCEQLADKDRATIIQACVDAGINKSTAATQYSRWRKQHASN